MMVECVSVAFLTYFTQVAKSTEWASLDTPLPQFLKATKADLLKVNSNTLIANMTPESQSRIGRIDIIQSRVSMSYASRLRMLPRYSKS